MNRELPTQLDLVGFAAGESLPGAWFKITLTMRAKNPFHLVFGPADDDGRLTVAKSDLERQVQSNMDLFVMDYAGLQEWSGSIRASVLDREAIARLVAARDLWGSANGVETSRELALLEVFRRRLETMPGVTLHVEARPVDGVADISTIETRA